MALYDDLMKKQEELQKQQIEVEKQLKEIKEQRKEEAIRQNLDYIMSIPEEDKKVLLKYAHHPSWCHKKNNRYNDYYINPTDNCPACVLEEIFNMKWEGYYAFSIDVKIHEVDEYDYKENKNENEANKNWGIF